MIYLVVLIIWFALGFAGAEIGLVWWRRVYPNDGRLDTHGAYILSLCAGPASFVVCLLLLLTNYD